MGSQQTLADEARLNAQLFRQCQQKRLYQQALLRVRDSRNDGDALLNDVIRNPNTLVSFTQDQLDMRRKAEILQYAGPSTQGGKQESKVKEWSRINQRFRSFTNYTSYLDLSCASLIYHRPTSTTECNVPGPPQMLVYDPTVTLSHFKGMRQDMRQLSVPSPALPPFTFVPFSRNVCTAKYKSGSYNVLDESAVPLNIASVTYFNISRRLECSVTFRLDAIVSFTLLDPTLSAYSNRVLVHSLQFIVNTIRPQIYVMTEPQQFTKDFLLSVDTLSPQFEKKFDKLVMPTKDNNFVYGNYTETYNIANNSQIKFPVQEITSIFQQTNRISLNVEFDLLVYDQYADINPALSINMDQLTVQFVLTPTSVLLA